MSALNILHIFPTFGLGGQQRRLIDVMNGLGEEASHTIISLSDDLAAATIAPDEHCAIKAVATTKSSFISLRAVQRLRQEISSVQPDILCTYNWGAIEAVVANSAGQRISHIHFEDGFGPDENADRQNIKRVVARMGLLRNAFVIVPSKSLENIALTQWRLSKNKVRYIPNGIDLKRFNFSDRPYAQRCVTIGSLGAIREEKNLPLLIDAFSRAELPAGRLMIYGDGPQKPSLEKMLVVSQIRDRLFLEGKTDTPEKAYRAMDVFAMSSSTEQMPLSLMEAMAAGLPVAATDVGDIRDMVSDENKYFITPSGDESALAKVLRALADDQDLRSRLGRANLQKAQHSFGLDTMVGRYRSLFKEVNLGAPATHAAA